MLIEIKSGLDSINSFNKRQMLIAKIPYKIIPINPQKTCPKSTEPKILTKTDTINKGINIKIIKIKLDKILEQIIFIDEKGKVFSQSTFELCKTKIGIIKLYT